MANLNILLVDDDADIGMFIKLKLSMEAPHFSIAFVESGLDCLDYLKTHTVDCILSDYQMPGMNGMELLLAMKGQGCDVPVIFVTGQGNEEVAREAFKNGAYDYFTKDVGFAHFARIINSVEQAVKQKTAEKAVRERDNALRLSQEFLKSIIDNEPECVKLISSDGSLIMMNRAGLDMIQADSLDQVKGKNMLDLVAPEYRRAFKALNMKVFQGGTGKLEFDVIGLKGRQLRLETNAVPLSDEKGKVSALLGITRDITEQKRAEQALKESEAMFRCLAEEALVGVYLIHDGRYVYVNQKAAEMWGYSREELLNFKSVLEVVHPDDRPRVRENIRKRVEGDVKSVNYPLRIVKKDGSILYLHALGSSTMYKGEPVIIGTAIDVTESNLLEQRRADFYAMVTHDIKAPLTAISGNMEILSGMPGKFDSDTNEILGAVRKSCEKIQRLVDTFLTFSETGSGKLAANIIPSNISEMLREAYKCLEKAIENKGISFCFEISDGLPATVPMDRQLVQRAVANLLQNALNYTPAGGKITLTAEAVSEKGDDFIMISVSDTGQGISAEERELVFEKYYRSPHTSWVKGSGLGLAIVKAVACAHGGKVELQSEPEKGSVFKIYLPAGACIG